MKHKSYMDGLEERERETVEMLNDPLYNKEPSTLTDKDINKIREVVREEIEKYNPSPCYEPNDGGSWVRVQRCEHGITYDKPCVECGRMGDPAYSL